MEGSAVYKAAVSISPVLLLVRLLTLISPTNTSCLGARAPREPSINSTILLESSSSSQNDEQQRQQHSKQQWPQLYWARNGGMKERYVISAFPPSTQPSR
jgi:hypothetical protein